MSYGGAKPNWGYHYIDTIYYVEFIEVAVNKAMLHETDHYEYDLPNFQTVSEHYTKYDVQARMSKRTLQVACEN